ncbi:MAG: hypothetical protein J7647_06335 [Cyanobacteria bacterium SBLK]|nr:hypothetical protein [Cyanobacteria bacterium SBLK]
MASSEVKFMETIQRPIATDRSYSLHRRNLAITTAEHPRICYYNPILLVPHCNQKTTLHHFMRSDNCQ